jgi:hypothetical protein
MDLNAIEITYGRALKIWWSYIWRAIVMMIPVLIIAMIISISILPFPKPGQPAPLLQPDQVPGMIGKTFALWLFMMALNIAVQVQAMRWMLKTKWSGFRLQAVADE